MKTLTKKQKEANGENFSRIVDDAASFYNGRQIT